MINIHVFVDNELLNSYWADGIIVSTPLQDRPVIRLVGEGLCCIHVLKVCDYNR